MQLRNSYWFELFIDELPLWVTTGFVGELRFDKNGENAKHVSYMHINFIIKYNGNQIHWFSIFNSFMMVIFLTGLVSMILMRTLRNEYAKYAREDDDLETLERDVSEDWLEAF